ncbi:MAG: DsbA family protein [Bacteroidetes bacterium]|nr:DsbA family protein [Bacteroidota bacterium]MBU1372284.1 DsbA family protein [Bacteroidota bacterium]MBU1486047.1 DsbA family protein [Bacteroidota bacterium]MBU1759479.1 DsbA family protein [Bacteroidota bacterium]MBU2268348.1 DsbA family protein [Bacteroidota bacterium]
MENGQFSLIYVYDALCGWCYGYSGVMKDIYEKYQDDFNFEVISGGMVLGESAGPITNRSALIKSHYPNVEETSQVKFGEPFIKALDEGGIYLSSEKPSIALSVFKTYLPDKAVLFAHALQKALNFEGKDLSRDETYINLVPHFEINPDEFIEKLNSEEFKQAAYYDFALARQLQVTGYPAAFIKTGDHHFYMIAKGYADLETMELRIANVLKETIA